MTLPLPLPPLDLANRVGALPTEQPYESYEQIGRLARSEIIAMLPPDFSFDGATVLDFGCGAGRVMRHFAEEATRAEVWGSDIDRASIDWLREELCPPFRVEVNEASPPLPFATDKFDLVWAVSAFTHITDLWSRWLLEIHRVLKPGGLFVCTFMGEGQSDEVVGEEWNENRVGMNVLRSGQSWDDGGPMVMHSSWWLRERWGRAFDVIDLKESGFARQPGKGHGLVLLRAKDVQLSPEDLERPSEDPRELQAITHNLALVQREVADLRWSHYQRAAIEQEVARLRERLAEVEGKLNRPPGGVAELIEVSPLIWQMHYGERCALEGVLGLVKPRLAVEIGTMRGGSLERLAQHADEVHSFDIVPAEAALRERLPGVHFHSGDSAETVPAFLSELASQGRSVDFALIDGDHSSEGVRRDAEAFLASDAARNAVLVFHDAANEEVRAGLEAVGFAGHPGVAAVLLDFVPGYIFEEGPHRFEVWNGLALVVRGDRSIQIQEPRRFSSAHTHWQMRDLLCETGGSFEDVAAVVAERNALREHLAGVLASRSWRWTRFVRRRPS